MTTRVVGTHTIRTIIQHNVAVTTDNKIIKTFINEKDFLNEVKAMDAVQGCPHVAHYTELGPGYMVMPHYGPTLHELLRRGTLNRHWLPRIKANVRSALVCCEAAGVRHGDVWPRNVCVSNDTGLATLIDFGVVHTKKSIDETMAELDKQIQTYETLYGSLHQWVMLTN